MRNVILLILLFIPQGFLFAEAIIELEEPGRRAIGTRTLYMMDPSRRLLLSDLLEAEARGNNIWSRSSEDSFSFGFSESAVWFTFTVKNAEDRPKKWYLETMIPIMDNIQLYTLNEDGTQGMIQTGNQFGVNSRSVYHRLYVFSFETPAHQSQRIFLRLYTNTSMNLKPFISLEESYQEHRYSEIPVPGLYYGFLILMMLYNFFLFVKMRELCYIYYSLYIFCLLVMAANLNGDTQLYLWPENGELSMKAVPFFSPMGAFAICHFVRHFVGVREYSSISDQYLKYLAGTNFLFAIFTVFYWDMRLINILTSYIAFGSISVFFPIIIYLSFIKKSREARFFFSGLLIVFCSGSHLYSFSL